jgi:hypothetical protein
MIVIEREIIGMKETRTKGVGHQRGIEMGLEVTVIGVVRKEVGKRKGEEKEKKMKENINMISMTDMTGMISMINTKNTTSMISTISMTSMTSIGIIKQIEGRV